MLSTDETKGHTQENVGVYHSLATGKEYVWFYPGEGCESPVGAPHDDSNRHVSLASACMERGVVQHELIHILGFWHEQSRTDRDKYVDIKWDNIEGGTVRWKQ